jgi:hypothetical protein
MRGSLKFDGAFDIERGYDKLMIGSTSITKTNSAKLPLIAQNGKVTFTSDGWVNKGPWKMCMGEAPPPPPPGSMNDDQKSFTSKTLGLYKALTLDCALAKVAQAHAEHMRDNNYFSSSSRSGKSISQQASDAGSSYRNLLVSAGTADVDYLIGSWKGRLRASSSRGFGVGIARGGQYGAYAVLLVNREDKLPRPTCMSGAELALGTPPFGDDDGIIMLTDEFEVEEETQAFSSLSPSLFSSVQNILAAFGVLGLGYGAYQVFCKKGAYNPVTYQEEI